MAENITAHMDKSLESLKHNFQGPYRSRQRQHSVRHHRRLLRCPHAGHAGCRRQDPRGSHAAHRAVGQGPHQRAIVKAIGASDLGITPNSDGTVVRLPFPAPTEERRRELVKECREYAEQAKVSIRNIRRDFNNKLERDEELTEDDVRREQAKVQKHTDEYVAKVEELLKEKEAEVMEI